MFKLKIIMLLPVALLLVAFCPGRETAAQNRPAPELVQDEAIRLSTDLVVLDVQVLKKKTGEIVNGLRPEDFELYEDGVRQEITHFSQDRLALSVILLMDLSGSVSPVLREIQNGALLALKRLKEKDEVAVMAFSDKTQLVQEFTTDRQLVVDRIGQIEKTPVIGQGTSLYQALRDAARHMNRAGNPASRRVIIVVTDNIAFEYRFFGITEQEVSEQVIESGSMVCGLIVEGAMTKSVRLFEKQQENNDLYRRRMSVDPFANQTGGEVIRADKTEVNARLALLIDHLRTRYSLGFSSRREKADGSFRRIALSLTPEARRRLGEVAIRSRQGYYARPRSPNAPHDQ
ncbi:MAG TPA: VWA domain-containing protein [Blastocatellia bacterium]|nr:VWA domain-containing protein [Blastocatellia bacterium]